MTFRYVSNNGDTIEFGGDSPYYADSDAMRSYEVKASLVRNAVTRFTHEAASVNLPISISAGTQEEGAALLDRLQQAFDHDVRANKAGRLEIDEYYANAFITTFGFDCDDALGLWETEVEAEVLLPNPVWILESRKSFNPSLGDVVSGGLNFPYNYPYNYCSGVTSRMITNPLSWPCAVRIVIYGEAHNPYVYIGDNRYEIDADVPEGGYLVIDGLDKSKIDLVDQYGNVTNVFDKRISGIAGSGTYIFEPIPSGYNPVTWDGSFKFDVVLCGERSWAPCTT